MSSVQTENGPISRESRISSWSTRWQTT